MNRMIVLALTCAVFTAGAEEQKPRSPGKNRADEPMASSFSLDQAAVYLDHASSEWTTRNKCGACHTNVPYLMARPALKGKPSAEHTMIRRFFEERVTHWDRGGKGDKPRWDAEVVTTAVALAVHDAHSTGKLHATTRQALDRMWTVQQKNGGWNWLKCKWPPMEHDDYFGAVMAAVGVGLAPEGYAKSEKAQAGLTKLRGYFQSNPPPTLHHKTWQLWAAQKLDGILGKDAQQQTIKELLKKQRPDGGWSLPSLGDWQGYDGRENDRNAPSDGYGTGLVVYVLRQSGLAADHPAILRGINWLKKNQRESGRWFTRSLNVDRQHYITNAGSAFAVLALKSCE